MSTLGRTPILTPPEDPIVGIDLGTTNSVVALAVESGGIQVLSDSLGRRVQPSIVGFHPDGSVLAGHAAKDRRVIDPRNTVHSAKRLMGRRLDAPGIASLVGRLPYSVGPGADHQALIRTRAGEFSPAEISAIMLDHMRDLARRSLATEVTRAVVTVPANFTDAQRAATESAGTIAGLDIPRVINEPTAAALAYGHQRQLDELIAVYDFGGGTFDITIVKLTGDVYEVLSTAGHRLLGGEDIDDRVVQVMVDTFLAAERVDLREDRAAMQRLRAVAEQIKIQLSRRQRALVKIDEIAFGTGGKPLTLHLEMSRQELNKHAKKIVDRTFPVCTEALRMAGLHRTDIEEVVLVGGTTRMPYVREAVASFFKRAPRTDVNPEEAIAMGAALQGMALRRGDDDRVRARSVGGDRLGSLFDNVPGLSAGQRAGSQVPGARSLDIDFGDDPSVVSSANRLSSFQHTGRIDLSSDDGGSIELDLASLLEGSDDPSISLELDAVTRDAPGLDAVLDSAERPTHTFDAVAPSADFFVGADPAPDVGSEMGLALDFNLEALAGAYGGDEPTASVALGNSDDMEATASVALADMVPARGPARPEDSDLLTDVQEQSSPSLGAIAIDEPVRTTEVPMLAITQALVESSERRSRPTLTAGPTGGIEKSAQDSQAPSVPKVIDVTPRGIGIGTVSGYCDLLIERNQRLPVAVTRSFSTSKDGQQSVDIEVCQGDSRRLVDNVRLGHLVLSDLAPRPRGQTHIEVVFEVDASGILRVRARDSATGSETRTELKIFGRTSDEHVRAAADRLRQILQ